MARGLTTAQQDRPTSRNVKALRALLPFVLQYKGRLLLVFIMLTIASLATLAVPLAVREMLDHGFSGESAANIDRYFLGVFLLAVVLAVSSAGRFFFVMQLGERIVADVRSAVYAHLLTLSPAFFERTNTGEILSRLTTDTTLIQSVVGASASIALRNIFMFVGAAGMLVYTSPRLSAYFLLLAPAVMLPLVVFGRTVRGQSNKAQEKVAHTSSRAEESLSAVRTVQAFSQEDNEVVRYNDTVEQAFHAAGKRIRMQAILTATIIFLVFSSITGILWTGSRFVVSGGMSSGELVSFIILAIMAAGALAALSEVWGDVQRAAGASERLMALLATRSDIEESDDPKMLPASKTRGLAFDGVNFRYPSRENIAVLKNFSLEVMPGEKVALVGPSGAGKSTVFQLLLRFYDPQQGRISISDTEIRDLSFLDLRSAISLVPQEAVIFAESAFENIRYGRPDATLDEVMQAAEVASADEFISALPEGYHTNLGQKGVGLSGGQKQRIAIARAVLKNAPILLLDEATSALDSESERLVQAALEKLMENHTTLIIAHRLSTILKADRIIVMDKGEIVESGTHKELLAQNGLYARLAEIQFGREGEEASNVVSLDKTH
ncbi:MAG: ATP-binding cassette domain-containing protein [Alphaproteobacteria bacterium]|nr:MAG: ATP-binding cassette domain-containing protein [Alphaproteobacteria bacterium]